MTTHVSDYQPCRVPLRRIKWCGVEILVHEGTIASLGRIEDRYEAEDGAARYPIRQRDTGAYNCRKTVSGRSWSKHSWGVAVDINWSTNPYGRTLVTDMPGWFVALFKQEGWGWGGDWSSVKDAMHMSRFPNEGGDGLLYVGTIEEGDEIDMATIAELRQVMDDALDARLGKKPAYASDAIEKPMIRGFKDEAGNAVYSEEIHDCFLMLVKLLENAGIDPATVVKLPPGD